MNLDLTKQDTNIENESIFMEIFDNNEILKSKYDILAGELPNEYNEVVLIVGKNSIIPDSVLYALDIKDRTEATELLNKAQKNNDVKIDSTTYSYDDIMNRQYKLVLSANYYKEENGIFIDYSNDQNYMKKIVDNGLDLKIVGIIRDNDASSMAKIGYKHSLTLYVINETSKTKIYKKQMENKEKSVLTGKKFDDIIDSFDDTAKLIGIADIDSINIYPKNFDSKDKIVKLIDEYNKKQEENNHKELTVKYTDIIKTLVGSVKSIVSIVSIVLIGLVAISLVVSSIMIAIITYISVLERTKEIGILRAIGASKKDVTRVFRAETIIEGLTAGVIGIVVAFLIMIPINVMVSKLAKINGIACLPIGGAIFLILLSVLLNVLAGVIPSKIAAKKDPVIALRSE